MSVSNSTLSDSDVATLWRIGHDTITNVVALVVETVLYTLYFVLVVMADRILLSRDRMKSHVFTYAVVVVMLMLDTATFFVDINNVLREISDTLTSSSLASLEDRYNNLTLPWTVENALYAIMSNLGDVIITWRAFAFWNQPQEQWVLLIPVAFLIGSFTSSGLIVYCVAMSNANPGLGNFVHPPFCVNVQIASYSMATATTAVATIMIGWKTWIYRRKIGSNLRLGNRRTRAEKIMVIFIESGVLYFLFFLSAVIQDAGAIPRLEASASQLVFANAVWTYMTSHIIGIYPVLVIILVHSQKSYIEPVTNRFSASLPSHSSHSHTWFSRSTLLNRSSWIKTKVEPPTTNRSRVVDFNVPDSQRAHPESSSSTRYLEAPTLNGELRSQTELSEKSEITTMVSGVKEA